MVRPFKVYFKRQIFWETFHGNFIYYQSFTRNLLRGNRRRNTFCSLFWYLAWPVQMSMSNKTTHYPLDYGDFNILKRCLKYSNNVDIAKHFCIKILAIFPTLTGHFGWVLSADNIKQTSTFLRQLKRGQQSMVDRVVRIVHFYLMLPIDPKSAAMSRVDIHT